jgi:hypothetical protein
MLPLAVVPRAETVHVRFSRAISRRGVAAIVTALALNIVFLWTPARGQNAISVGDHVLLPNTPNQQFTISVTGTDTQIAGEDFFAQIGDGGSFNGGSDSKPVFQNVDILNNTIFNGNNTGATGDPNGSPKGSNAGHPLIWVDGTTSNTGTVSDLGVLATFTIDTTGVSSGTFPFLLTGVADSLGGFSTTFNDAGGSPVPLTITNGTLTVQAPEPASVGIFMMAMAATLCRRRKHGISR